MAGRCICESAPATGAALVTSGCLSVSGAGTPSSPFNLALLASCLPPKSCTSGTRPSGPAEGQIIWETDTDRLRVWDGATWRLLNVDKMHMTQQFFGPAVAAKVNLSNDTIINDTVTNPWDATDPFWAEFIGSLAVNGTAGDLWDLRLLVGGIEQDRSRISIGSSGWGSAKVVAGVRSTFGAPLSVQMFLLYVGGSSVYSIFVAPALLNSLIVDIEPD